MAALYEPLSIIKQVRFYWQLCYVAPWYSISLQRTLGWCVAPSMHCCVVKIIKALCTHVLQVPEHTSSLLGLW